MEAAYSGVVPLAWALFTSAFAASSFATISVWPIWEAMCSGVPPAAHRACSARWRALRWRRARRHVVAAKKRSRSRGRAAPNTLRSSRRRRPRAARSRRRRPAMSRRHFGRAAEAAPRLLGASPALHFCSTTAGASCVPWALFRDTRMRVSGRSGRWPRTWTAAPADMDLMGCVAEHAGHPRSANIACPRQAERAHREKRNGVHDQARAARARRKRLQDLCRTRLHGFAASTAAAPGCPQPRRTPPRSRDRSRRRGSSAASRMKGRSLSARAPRSG